MFRLSICLLVIGASGCGPDGTFLGEDEVLRFNSDLNSTDYWRPSDQPLATGTSFELRVLHVLDAELSVDGAAAATWRGPDFVRVEAMQSGDAWIDVTAWNDKGDVLQDGVGFDVADVHRLSTIDEAARQFAWVQQLAADNDVPVRVVGDSPPDHEAIYPIVRGAELAVLPILLDDQERPLRFDLSDVHVEGARAERSRIWVQDPAGATVVRHKGAVIGSVLFEAVDVDDVAYVDVVALDAGLAGPELCLNAVVWAVPYTADGRRVLGAPVHIDGARDVVVRSLVEEYPLDELVGVYTVADTPTSQLELGVTVGALAQRIVLPIGLLPVKDSCL